MTRLRPYPFGNVAATGGAPPDVTAPTVSSCTVAADGVTVTVGFSEAVTGSTGFTLVVGARTLSLTYATGDGTDTFTFAIAEKIYHGDTVTLSYAPGDFENENGTPLEAFSGAAVGADGAPDWTPAEWGSSLILGLDWTTGITLDGSSKVETWTNGYGGTAPDFAHATAGNRPSATSVGVGNVPTFEPGKWLEAGDFTGLGLAEGTLFLRGRCDAAAADKLMIDTNGDAIDTYDVFTGTGLSYPSALRTNRIDSQPALASTSSIGWVDRVVSSKNGQYRIWQSVDGGEWQLLVNTTGTFSAGAGWRLAKGKASQRWQGPIAAVFLVAVAVDDLTDVNTARQIEWNRQAVTPA